MSEKLTEAELDEFRQLLIGYDVDRNAKSILSDANVERLIAAARKGLEADIMLEDMRTRLPYPTVPPSEDSTKPLAANPAIGEMTYREAEAKFIDNCNKAKSLAAPSDYSGPDPFYDEKDADPVVADSLKERLRAWSVRPNNKPAWKTCRDALARIEELEEVQRAQAETLLRRKATGVVTEEWPYKLLEPAASLIERQAAEIEGEKAIASGWHRRWKEAQAEIERLREELESIAKNTCCDKCQETALVARSALSTTGEKYDART